MIARGKVKDESQTLGRNNTEERVGQKDLEPRFKHVKYRFKHVKIVVPVGHSMKMHIKKLDTLVWTHLNAIFFFPPEIRLNCHETFLC